MCKAVCVRHLGKPRPTRVFTRNDKYDSRVFSVRVLSPAFRSYIAMIGEMACCVLARTGLIHIDNSLPRKNAVQCFESFTVPSTLPSTHARIPVCVRARTAKLASCCVRPILVACLRLLFCFHPLFFLSRVCGPAVFGRRPHRPRS